MNQKKLGEIINGVSETIKDLPIMYVTKDDWVVCGSSRFDQRSFILTSDEAKKIKEAIKQYD